MRTNIVIDDKWVTDTLRACGSTPFGELPHRRPRSSIRVLENGPVVAGDVILSEVLQGFGSDRDFNQAKRLLTSFEVVELGGQEIAIQAARNSRILRARRITVRKTINTLIATRRIESDYALLFSDRDF